MRETSTETENTGLCRDSTYELGGSTKFVLDQELAGLPQRNVSEQDTRYPTDAASMRAFLEVFFTRHLFQLQNSLMDYVTSPDFNETFQLGSLRILDIGSGPAVASQALTDIVTRTIGDADSVVSRQYSPFRMIHVLNDTSSICLVTGRRMLVGYSHAPGQPCSVAHRLQIFTLPTAFPGNLYQIRDLASSLGNFDLVVLSYVLHPLTEDGSLQSLVSGLSMLERFCKPRGRVLIVQDRFQEPLIRKLAGIIGVECREQMLTQRIYPPRGSNETGTYTYYDCLYTPRKRVPSTETCDPNLTR